MTERQATPPTLSEAIAKLAEARRAHRQARHMLALAREAFEVDHAVEIANERELGERVANLDAIARELAINVYADTGDTAPAPGVSLSLATHATYNKNEALEWARTALPSAVIPEQLDVKIFDKIARTGTLGFVRLDTVPTVKIASDLDAALGKVTS